MTDDDLTKLERLVAGWAGTFDASTDDDDADILTFRPVACEDCDDDCDCAVNVAEYAMAHECIAQMLNALPALLAEVRRLRGDFVIEGAAPVVLDDAAFDALTAKLADPSPPNEKLVELMRGNHVYARSLSLRAALWCLARNLRDAAGCALAAQLRDHACRYEEGWGSIPGWWPNCDGKPAPGWEP